MIHSNQSANKVTCCFCWCCCCSLLNFIRDVVNGYDERSHLKTQIKISMWSRISNRKCCQKLRDFVFFSSELKLIRINHMLTNLFNHELPHNFLTRENIPLFIFDFLICSFSFMFNCFEEWCFCDIFYEWFSVFQSTEIWFLCSNPLSYFHDFHSKFHV